MSEKHPLPTAVPEQLGIPSKAISRFIRRLETKRLCMHSALLLRHGRIAAEAYWKPFDADFKHRMYSTSKSFVSVAVGILIGEGKLSLDDRVVDFFPEYRDESLSPYTAATTVRDLLMMTTPFTDCNYFPSMDWTEAFFKMPATHLPGKSYRYDTLATVMLCILVRRVSGVEFVEYLRERLFRPAGMSEDIWCIQSPCGHDWGGSGVLCTTRDLAKFALVCMNGGRAGGEQLIPARYIADATSCLVDNAVSTSDPEHQFGYGYQFWRTRHGFACRGMGSQLAICDPEADLILITTADTQAVPSGCALIYDALWEEIYPYLTDGALPADADSHRELCECLSGLSLLTVEGSMTSPMAVEVSGRTYTLTENAMHMRNIRFTFVDDEGRITYENDTGRHELGFGFGWQSEQEFPETHYDGKRIHTPLGRGYTCHTSAAWKLDNSLVLYCYATDWYFGTLKMNFVFDGDTVTIQSEKFAEMFFTEYQGFASGTCE